MENFSFSRVITKDAITDSFQGLRNLFGMRLRAYEDMINKHIKNVMKESELKYKIKWYRMIVNPLTNGSVMIIMYGEGEKNE